MKSSATWPATDQTTPDGNEAPNKMAELAAAAARDLADAPAQDVIAWATETFGDRVCITSSMTDAVIIHLAASVKPGLDVIFLDTTRATASVLVANHELSSGADDLATEDTGFPLPEWASAVAEAWEKEKKKK